MKKLISAMLATATATLLGVLMAPAASAHSNGITGTTACRPDGTQVVSWTISNDYKTSVIVTQTSSTGGGTLTGLPTTIAARTGSALTTAVVEQSGIPGNAKSASLGIKGLWTDGYTKSMSKILTLAGCQPAPTLVKAAAPTVTQSSACDVPGSYTVPAVTGVTYLLDGRPTKPGIYTGATTGTLTAVADSGYVLTGASSFPIAVDKAATCPKVTTAAKPTVTQSSACDVPGSYTVPAVTGVTYLLDGRPTKPGTYTGATTGTLTAVADAGYVLTGASSFPIVVDKAATCPTVVTAVAPMVTPSSACDVPGSYTVPAVTGVTYLLDGQPIKPGTYTGALSGTVTASAVDGYILQGNGTFPVIVTPAATCPIVVTAAAPTVTASSACDVPGSYTVPAVTGVTYQLDGQPVSAGTHTGSFTGTLTAVADAGYVLTGLGSFPVSVNPAAVCPAVVPDVVPQTVPPVVTTPTGLFPSVGVSAAFLEAPAVAQAAAAQPQAPALAATGTSGALPVGTMGAVFLLLGGSLFLLRRRLR
ncbi:MAG: hypothetical protein M3Z83_02995 [Actinomycetota bacterium]|nr:hypothetical protein [Actinomycetota bacterium]